MKNFITLVLVLAVLCVASIPQPAFAGGTLILDKTANPIQFLGPATVESGKLTSAGGSAGVQGTTFGVTGLGLIEIVTSGDTYLYLNGASPGYLVKASTYLQYAVPAKLTSVVFKNASTASAATVYLLKHR